MSAAPRVVVPDGMTLAEVEAQLRHWVRTGETLRALSDEAWGEGAPPEVLKQMARYHRTIAVEVMKWDNLRRAMRAMRGDL